MTEPAFIAGDWGTTRLRLYLCGADGAVLARSEAEGAAVPGHAERFAAAVAPWDGAHGKLPAVLGGMVGSTIGWKDVPYFSCPARPGDIAGGALRFEHDGRAIAIVPGLKCAGPAGAPDVMRGEEVQILGALQLSPKLAQGNHLLCLPGTHTKWVQVKNGAVQEFQTALSGELFALLRNHSVLARDGGEIEPDGAAFARGVAMARDSGVDLLYLLFSARSRVVTGEMSKTNAASYLSGLIIGKDVEAAVGASTSLFSAERVHLICAPMLARLYANALDIQGLSTHVIDGDDAALAGLTALHAELFS